MLILVYAMDILIFDLFLFLGDMDIRIANKYRLGRKIGGGSFGDIYLGKYFFSFLNVHIQ